MHLLIAGGAGYIGSHVTRAFLDAGDQVTVLDNFSSGCRENCFKEARLVEGSIGDSAMLTDLFNEPFDGVVHLAAYKAAGESMEQPGKYATNNICGTISLLNAAVEAGIGAIVFSSSAAVYGEPRHLPLDEDHPLEPENFYGFTKWEIERLLEWYARLTPLSYAALRYFNAAGYDPEGRIPGLERNPANLLPIIMEAAAGMREHVAIFGTDYPTPDGTGVRDYVHVTDLADAHVRAMRYLVTKKESITVNLGSESGISVREMLIMARKITERPIPEIIAPRRAGDPAQLFATSARARRLLEWEPRYSDPESLVATTSKAYTRAGLTGA
jgi:UDP-glucose 4-epimerase